MTPPTPTSRRAARTERRGNYSMLIGLLIPVLMGFAALGVDLSYLQLAHLQAQYAADAASHAAFVVFRSTGEEAEGTAAAEYILSQVRVGGGTPHLDSIVYGEYETSFSAGGTDINAVRVRVSRTDDNSVRLFFAGFLGWAEAGVVADATTAGRTRHIMIVQDITGSFKDDIDDARVADVAFLDFMYNNPYPDDMIGMSTFVGGVTPATWSPMVALVPNYASIRARWLTLDWCNCTPASAQAYFAATYGSSSASSYCLPGACPLSSWSQYCTQFMGGNNTRSAMVDCWSVGTNTAQGPGIDQAIDELIDFGTARSFRAIILVSDGLPCCDPLTAARRTAAETAVDRAWDNDIHVWSVAFNKGGGDFDWLQSLTRGMGQAYETPDASELEGIMLEIAASIPVVTVE